jgi:hypothetical protein
MTDHTSTPSRSGLAGLQLQPVDFMSNATLGGYRTPQAQFAALPAAVNQNVVDLAPALPFRLTDNLPPAIRSAVIDWAKHIKVMTWAMRRRAISRFAESFADNFMAVLPNLDDAEYESLTDIGYSCLIELIDDGLPISDTHQARCFMKSVHEQHQERARAFLASSRPQPVTVH